MFTNPAARSPGAMTLQGRMRPNTRIVLAVIGYFTLAACNGSASSAPPAAQRPTTLEEIEAKAKEDFPGAARPDAVRREAAKQQAAVLATASQRNQQIHAATIFLGYYWMNDRARPAYCKQLGVDIAPFVIRFDATNREAAARAKALIKRISVSEDEYYAMAAPELAKGSQHDMEDAAASDRITTRQVCEQIRDDPVTAVSDLTYSKVNPTGYQVLMATD
jgi:hypothetical protein